MKIIEQDSGLWQVWDKAGRHMGYIFDGGWKTAMARRHKNSLYHAMLNWSGYPWYMNIQCGSHRNFMKTVSKLFK